MAKKLSLFKYNKITGYWNHTHSFDNPSNGPEYLAYYKKDEPQEHFHLSIHTPKHDPRKKTNEENTKYRDKPAGPINFVYQGDKHVGNIIEPKTFIAVSKLWGKKTTHDSKAAAMAWLKGSHGATMKTEAADNGSIHDVLRQHNWVKAQPYGFKYHVMANDRVRYAHRDLPGHHIVASYHDGSWQHHTRSDSTSAHVSYGAAKLHSLLQKLHGTKKEETLRNFVNYFRENEPDDWRDLVLDIVGGKLPIMENEHPVSVTHNNHTYYKTGKLGKRTSDKVDSAEYSRHTNYGKPHNTEYRLWRTKHGELYDLEEGMEQSVQGSTPHSTMQQAVKASKLSIIKKQPTILLGNPKPNSVSEEIFDWEKNQKDPTAGPQPKVKQDKSAKIGSDLEKQGPKPVPSVDAESEVNIKRTMTGEPGTTILINPKLQTLPKNNPAGGGTKEFNAPENKKRPMT